MRPLRNRGIPGRGPGVYFKHKRVWRRNAPVVVWDIETDIRKRHAKYSGRFSSAISLVLNLPDHNLAIASHEWEEMRPAPSNASDKKIHEKKLVAAVCRGEVSAFRYACFLHPGVVTSGAYHRGLYFWKPCAQFQHQLQSIKSWTILITRRFTFMGMVFPLKASSSVTETDPPMSRLCVRAAS